MCSNEEDDRLLLCAVLHTKNKSREQRREKTEVKLGGKVRKRTQKRHLETGEHRKRFQLTGVINNGPNCSFKDLDLAGSSC